MSYKEEARYLEGESGVGMVPKAKYGVGGGEGGQETEGGRKQRTRKRRRSPEEKPSLAFKEPAHPAAASDAQPAVAPVTREKSQSNL